MTLEPNIKIGGVPIVEQSFTWRLTPGANPFITSVIIPKGAINDQLKSLENPTDITIEVWGGLGVQPEKQEFTIKDVYLIQPKEKNAINATWQIADKRFAWRGEKIFCSYNKTREKNDIIRAISGVPETDPYIIRQITDRYKSGKYLAWSVKEDGSPYSMLEILQRELDKFGVTIDPADIGEISSYTVENVQLEGADVYQGLNDLLQKSRLSMSVTLDGNIEVYSVDFFDKVNEDLLDFLKDIPRTGPNLLYRQEMYRTRPSTVTVHFEKKIETKLVATSSENLEIPGREPIQLTPKPPAYTRENIEERRAIGCENVIQVPYPYTDSNEKIWNLGEYVPMWKYLKDMNILESEVRNYYFTDYLAYVLAARYAKGAAVNPERLQLAFHIVSAIKYHYRQTYQIDPYYMDRIKSWEARRVAVLDNYSRFSPPSPLWADYLIAPNIRIPMMAKKLALWDNVRYIPWYVDEQDPNREKPTLGSIRITNHPLGIFRIHYPSDFTRNIKQIVPGAVEYGSLPGAAPVGGILTQLNQMRLAENHVMETLVSIIWHTDSSDNFDSRGKELPVFEQIVANKYASIYLDYSSLGGKGSEIEYLSKLDYARYQFPITIGSEQVQNPNPDNIGNLEDMAQAEGAKIINHYRDRVSGTAVYAGAITGILKMMGNILSITYNFFPGRGLETTLSIAEFTPKPTLEQTLEQDTLSYLQRQVTRSGNQNNLGASI